MKPKEPDWQTGRWLEPLPRQRLPEYAKERPPGATDRAVIEALRAFEAADETTRGEITKRVEDDHAFGLLYVAERMAALAVRSHDVAYVYWGLLAIVVEDLRWDAREDMLVLSLLDHSATKLGEDPVALFERAATIARPETAELLRAFVARPPSLKSIAVMGYVESLDDGEFTYKRTW